MQPRKFYVDTVNRAFVASPDGTLPAGGLNAFDEDVESVELYFLETTGSFSQPYRYLDYSSNTVKLAVGLTAPAALLTSFSAISTAVAITPSVSITGGSGVTEVQRVQISPQPATGFYSLKLPARNVTVSSVSASLFIAPYHGLLDGQSVTLTGFSSPSGFSNGSVYWVRDRTRDSFKIANSAGATAITASVSSGGGTAQLPNATTEPLPAGSATGEIASALARAAGSSTQEISVTGASSDYLLSYSGAYAGADMPLVEVVGNTLAGAPGLSGNLNFDTSEVAALIAAGSNDVRFEVEVSDGTLRQTFQTSAQLSSDIITSSSPAPLPTITPATSFNLISPDTSVWNVTIDDNGILAVTKV